MAKHEQYGQGIFLTPKGTLQSNYAKKRVAAEPCLKSHYLILEQEATIPIQNAIHGMCRDQLLKEEPEFLEIIKELNPSKYEHYLKRKETMSN